MSVRPVPAVTRVMRFVLRPLLILVTKRDWRGAENLPTTGGYIIAVNHVSHLDPILLAHWMLDHNIAPRFLAKDTLFNKPVLGWIIRKTGQIPVYRSTAAASQSLRGAAEAIRSGQIVTIYPEGTITRDSRAWPMSGRTGAVRLALMTQAPLIPVMQWGPQDILWPYTKKPRFFPRKTMHVRVLEPFDLSAYRGEGPDEEMLRKATGELMDQITAMQSDVRGELPSRPRIDLRTLGASRTNYRQRDEEMDS